MARGNRLRLFAAPLLLLALSGCDTTGFGDTAAGKAEAPDEADSAVLVADALPPDAMVIGEISAIDCRGGMGKTAPSQKAALALLKLEAAKRGATMLTAVSYQPPEAGAACASGIEAIGTAAKY